MEHHTMTSNTSGNSGANWSGILIALIGAISTLAATWLTIQHSATAAPAPSTPMVQTQGLSTVPGVVSPAAQAMLIIPDVRNLSLQQAQRQLSALGLTIVITNTPDQQPVGTVLNITPAPGQTAAISSSVIVQVSAGPSSSTSRGDSEESDEKDGKGKKDD
jgi:hypothetical protein